MTAIESANAVANDRHPEFPLEQGLHYLNHAAVSPWPARTVAAVTGFARENGSVGARNYGQWLATEKRLRERLARITGARSCAEIALVKNTSAGLSAVAFGLDWREGDEIVISNQEFPSNRVVWKALEPRFGVRVVEVDLGQGSTPEDSLLAAVGPRTRLLSISSVQYGTGLRIDLARLGAYLHQRGVLFCVDAIQSLGAMPFDVESDHVDFLAADGHKWMLGPEGLAVLYVRAEHIGRMRLHEFGWHMLASRGHYDVPSITPMEDATRFECGSPNLVGIMALDASLSLLEERGLAHVQEDIQDRTMELARRLDRLAGVTILTNLAPGRSLGILTFKSSAAESGTLVRELNARGVICAARGGGVRFSPHFYTPESTIAESCGILASLLEGNAS